MKVSDFFLSDPDPKPRVCARNSFIYFPLIYSFFLNAHKGLTCTPPSPHPGIQGDQILS